MKKILTFFCFSTLLLSACSSSQSMLEFDSQNLPNGIFEKLAENPDEYGYYAYTILAFEDGKIISVVSDAINNFGEHKYLRSADDFYVMSSEENASWSEQIDLFNDYVIENQSVMTTGFTNGKVDSISGCTIAVQDHTELISAIIFDPLNHYMQIETNQDGFADGEYFGIADNPDEDGFFATATITFKDEYIVSVSLDAIDENGVSKYTLSLDGESFTDSAQPLWHQQIDAYADYILDLQFAPNVHFNDDGSVSNVDGVFIPVFEHAMLISDILNRLI